MVPRKRCSENTQQIYKRILHQSNFIEITLQHVCSPVNLLHIFKTLREQTKIIKIEIKFFDRKQSKLKLLSSQPLFYESRMFEIGFLCPKSVKEMEKRRVRRERIGFGAERNGL